jgi:hypothetical protein
VDAYGASIYIVHHLERITNNMGQIFGKEKHSLEEKDQYVTNAFTITCDYLVFSN